MKMHANAYQLLLAVFRGDNERSPTEEEDRLLKAVRQK